MEFELTLQRYLDDFEVLATRTWAANSVVYEGHVDEDVMSRAFALLCVRYPVLRGRIRPDERGNLLYVSPGHHPDFIVLDGDESTLQREIERPLDPARAVVQLMLIRGEARGFLAVRANHAVIDGHSWWAMLDDLWRLYTNIVNGADVSVDPGVSLPSPPSALLEERWGGFAPVRRRLDGIQSDTSPDKTDQPNPREVCERVARRFRLTEEETAQLVAAARTHKTSVHAILCGVFLVAQRALGAPPEPTSMMCQSIIDLRNLVTPPVGATEATNFIGWHRAEVTVPANGNPIVVGRQVKRQLDTAIARRELLTLRQMRAPFRFETPLEQHLAIVAVTNGGVMPRFSQPDGLTITDYWMPISKTGPRRRTNPTYIVYTYAGRLDITCTGSSEVFTTEKVEQLLKGIKEQLVYISMPNPNP